MTISLVIASWSSTSAQDVKVSVNPAIAATGAQVRVNVRLEREADNRVLVIEVESADYYRRTEIELDGTDSASVHTLELRSLPEGTYAARAVLQQTDHTVVSSPVLFRVVGADLPVP